MSKVIVRSVSAGRAVATSLARRGAVRTLMEITNKMKGVCTTTDSTFLIELQVNPSFVWCSCTSNRCVYLVVRTHLLIATTTNVRHVQRDGCGVAGDLLFPLWNFRLLWLASGTGGFVFCVAARPTRRVTEFRLHAYSHF